MPYKQDMRLEGIEEGYKVFKNAEGFMEGYKSVGKNAYNPDWPGGSDVKRIVSNATTLEGFAAYVRGLRAKTSIKDRPVKTRDLPSLSGDDPVTI